MEFYCDTFNVVLKLLSILTGLNDIRLLVHLGRIRGVPEGEENVSHKNVNVDYFQLKAIKAHHTQENRLPLLGLKEFK